MRKPRAPASIHHVRVALGLAKELQTTREQILAEAALPDGFACGSRRDRWVVEIVSSRNVLRAKLVCDGAVILNLDHHATPGRIAIGYHWDVRPPLVREAERIYIEPQPESVWDALEYLQVFWNLVLVEGTRRLL